jgi:hypothetical protein
VRAPWLDGQRIVAFSVSRDGVRLAAILEHRDGSRDLVMSTIDRGSGAPTDQQPVVLRAPTRIMNPSVTLTRLIDLAWVSPTSLAVLGAEARSEPQPYEVTIDGSEIESSGGFLKPRLVAIAAGPNTDAPIAVAARNGKVLVQAPDLNWSRVTASSPLYAPVYPG